MRKIAFAMLAFLTLSSMICKKETQNCHLKISFVNSSARDVYVALDDYQIKDVLVNETYTSLLAYPVNHKVSKSTRGTNSLRRKGCIEKSFTSEKPVSNLHVYVFDAEKIENTELSVLDREKYFLKNMNLPGRNLGS